MNDLSIKATGATVTRAAAHAERDGRMRHVLQRVLLPKEDTISDLYYVTSAEGAKVDGTAIAITEGATVSFGTYFNSFYESYWAKYAQIGALALAVTISGKAKVAVFRSSEQNGLKKVVTTTVSNKTANRLVVSLPDRTQFTDCGRLYFEIVALDDEVSVSEAAFVTDVAPSSEISLSIGLCTFNREEYLAETLASISEEVSFGLPVTRVYVVNQSDEFSNDLLTETLSQNKELIKVIRQPNLGGCGGFTRSMFESLEDNDASYHLLMDDDIVLDARVIERVVSLLRYAKSEICIGGHMLDMLRPNVLYEAGAVVRANNTLENVGHNLDLCEMRSLDNFNCVRNVHYNAWWFCAFPTRVAREIELPAPIFIRGDDLEFGIRLREAGVETVALPGVGVWHEPFYLKAAGWQTYYDLRNRLIFASVYSDMVKRDGVLQLCWRLLRSLCAHDYQQAKWIELAIRDYLLGPKGLFEKSQPELHAEVSRVAREWGPEKYDSARSAGMSLEAGKPMPANLAVQALTFLKRAVQITLFAKPNAEPKLLLDCDANIRNVNHKPYVLTNGVRSFFLLFAPNRRRFMSLLFSGLRAISLYGFRSKHVEKTWQDQITAFRKMEYWRGVFGKSRD